MVISRINYPFYNLLKSLNPILEIFMEFVIHNIKFLKKYTWCFDCGWQQVRRADRAWGRMWH